MLPQFARRRFLQVALGAGALACGVCPAAPAWAVPPIPRNGTPKFKFSLAAYSYRDLLNGAMPKLTLHEFVEDGAKMGLEAVELTSYYFPKNVGPDFLRNLKRRCFQLGLDVSGTAVGNDFGQPAGPKRQEQIELVKRWVDFSEILGAPVIRVFAGHAAKDSSPTEAHALMVAGLEECCEYAGRHGVHLALENHGGPTATADGLLAFVRDVQSPWFGVNMDTGNFRTDDIYGDLARIAPYALNVQVKVVVTGADGKKQPTDFKRLAQILRDANYRGYIVLEYEEPGDPRAECPKFMDALRAAFA